ncbi:MAG: DUF2325 domain-containing protein [Alphaproteobacteria bacterium]|nr:DUF2325 domain-containing protein [Alphaproteobacteria bacterium]
MCRSLHHPSAAAGAVDPLVQRALAALALERPAAAPRLAKRRAIWELSPNLHCSIIGTCLSTAELRRVLGKAGLAVAAASDHQLHTEAVRLADRHAGPAKLLNKLLDERHRLAIRQFEAAASEAALRALWQAARERGDIPGAYWAALTHPAASEALVADVFGDVHMLSHLVGAANRADIRRLAALEAEKAALEAKVAKQQEQLRDAVSARDAKIRELSALLARKLTIEADETGAREREAPEGASLVALIAERERRLDKEIQRRRLLEERLQASRDEAAQERAGRLAAEQQEARLRDELAALEAEAAPEFGDAAARGGPRLDGRTLLYVGGRLAQVTQIRAAAARLGAEMLHHDGGMEDNAALLPGLIGRADTVLFPVDCVSHAAVATVKQFCRQAGKPYLALRSSGLGAFLAGVARLPAPELALG